MRTVDVSLAEMLKLLTVGAPGPNSMFGAQIKGSAVDAEQLGYKLGRAVDSSISLGAGDDLLVLPDTRVRFRAFGSDGTVRMLEHVEIAP